jgi:flagella basal body P-ring formation protein FlgA
MLLPRSPKLVKITLLTFATFQADALAEQRASVDTQIESAARAWLAAETQHAGLKDSSVSVVVLPRQHASAYGICQGKLRVDPLDTHSFNRMRFAAVCDDTPSWRDERVVRGTVSAVVVVAAEAITAGRPIAAGDLKLERRDIRSIMDAVSDVEDVIGRASRHPLRNGDAIAQSALLEPLLVKRGSLVNITARAAGVEAQVTGEVLEPGHRNEIVRVRNTASGKIIRARVVSEDTVEPAELPVSAPAP